MLNFISESGRRELFGGKTEIVTFLSNANTNNEHANNGSLMRAATVKPYIAAYCSLELETGRDESWEFREVPAQEERRFTALRLSKASFI